MLLWAHSFRWTSKIHWGYHFFKNWKLHFTNEGKPPVASSWCPEVVLHPFIEKKCLKLKQREFGKKFRNF
jgi:hypothetical protein